MIFELVRDFAEILDEIPKGYSGRRNLTLLDEAVRRDSQFIERHPTTLFQCLWNTCWWYDCPEAASKYANFPCDSNAYNLNNSLSQSLEVWRNVKGQATPNHFWVRSTRPPSIRLGTAIRWNASVHTSEIIAVSVSHDGTLIASAARDDIGICDLMTGFQLAQIQIPVKQIASLCWSLDSVHLYAAMSLEDDFIGEIMSIEVSSQTVSVLYSRKNCQAVFSLLSPCGDRIAASWSDGTVEIIDLNGALMRQIQPGVDYSKVDLAWSPDGALLAIATNQSVEVWNVSENTMIWSGHSHTGTGIALAWSPQFHYIATGGIDGKVAVWELGTDAPPKLIDAAPNLAFSLAFSPGGDTLAIGSGMPVTLWRSPEWNSIGMLPPFGLVTRIAFSPDGSFVACGNAEGDVRIINAKCSEEKPIARIEPRPWEHHALSRDGTMVVLCNGWFGDSEVQVWDVCSGRERMHIKGSFASAALSPDNQLLALRAQDGSVRIWDLGSAAEVHVLVGHHKYSTALCWHPLRPRIAAGGHDAVWVWDLECRSRVAELSVGFGLICEIAYSPNGKAIAAGVADGSIHIWQCENSHSSIVLRGHDSRVLWLRFSPDSQTLYSVSGGRNQRLWKVSDGQEITGSFSLGGIPLRSLLRKTDLRIIGRDGQIIDSASGKVRGWFPGSRSEWSLSENCRSIAGRRYGLELLRIEGMFLGAEHDGMVVPPRGDA